MTKQFFSSVPFLIQNRTSQTKALPQHFWNTNQLCYIFHLFFEIFDDYSLLLHTSQEAQYKVTKLAIHSTS